MPVPTLAATNPLSGPTDAPGHAAKAPSRNTAPSTSACLACWTPRSRAWAWIVRGWCPSARSNAGTRPSSTRAHRHDRPRADSAPGAGDSATRDFDREVERFLERWRPVVASLMDDLLLRPPSVLGAIRHAGQLSRLRGTAGEAVRSAFSRRLGPGCAGRVPAVCRRARGPGPRSVDRRTCRPARRGLLPAGWRRKLDSRRARRWPGVARRPREPALPDRTHPRVPRGAPSGRTRSTCRTGAGVLACAMGTSPGFRRGLSQSGVG